MAFSTRFRVLYSDIGGVLGNNGWDSALRRKVCEHFGVSHESIDPRHRLLFDTFERGHIRFDDYLQTVFFAQPREFELPELKQFVYEASVAWEENIAFMYEVKKLNGLKLALISNEGQGITENRIEKFRLRELADFMVISHFTGMRKPDHSIWKLALDLAGAEPGESIYIDDREVFAEISARIGFASIHHTSLARTREQLAELGLQVPS